MALTIGRLIQKYCLVVGFPLITVTSIYLDYSRTQLYKAKLKRQDGIEHFS